MSRIVSYGFPLAKAQTLSGIADREATRQRKGPSVSYGAPIGSAAQIVQMWKFTGSPVLGDLITPNSDGYHTGRLRFYGDGTENNIGANCWIGLIDWEDNDLGQVVGEHGRHYVGVPMGNVTSGGTEAPAFLVAVGEMQFLGKPDSTISKGSSGVVSLYHRSTPIDSGINLTCIAPGAAVTSAKFCWVTRPACGQIVASPYECP